VKKQENFSIIDSDLTIDGLISCKGKFIIKGAVKGTLIGETVIISKEGAVYADAKVHDLTIGGTFEGEVNATGKLIVLSTGICSGKVTCKKFVVEAGGMLNADVTCIADQNHQIKKKEISSESDNLTVL